MGNEALTKVQELFERALERSPDEREAFLRRVCGDDSAQLAEVLSLLEHDSAATGLFMRPPERDRSAEPEEDPLVGTRVGRYHILRSIAAGGMGAVYEAEQEQPVRRVAIKILGSWCRAASARRRFELEGQTLARLNHPNIAKIYEAGRHERRPYFAMEYVDGAETLTDYAVRARLSTAQRLSLFLTVCRAVQYGHDRQIIHRDLKPGNILVNGEGVVKIIDFGVARATDSDVAATTVRTNLGELVGTLQYMSPEQCAADTLDLDVRTDVYSLGVVLYELITGRLPYDVSRSSIQQAARTISEEPAMRPRSVSPQLNADLETIMLKALQKGPDDRYRSAADLAEDIERHLRHEPIRARRPTWARQVGLFARRNTAVTIVGLALLGSLIAFAASMTFMAWRLKEEVRLGRWNQYLSNVRLAATSLWNDDPYTVRRAMNAAPKELRNWEWKYLSAQSDQSLSSVGLEAYPERNNFAISQDGKLVAGLTSDGVVRLWNAESGALLASFKHGIDNANLMSLSADGGTVAVAMQDGASVAVWRLKPPRHIATIRNPPGVETRFIALSPGGSLLAVATRDSAIRLYETATGRIAKTLHLNASSAELSFGGNGDVLSYATKDGAVHVVNLGTGRDWSSGGGQTGELLQTRLAVSGDGKRVMFGDDRAIQVWNVPSNVGEFEFPNEGPGSHAMFFDPSGQWAAVLCPPGCTIVDLRNHKSFKLIGDSKPAAGAFDLAHHRLVTVSLDGVRTWALQSPAQYRVLKGHTDAMRSVAFSPDGHRLASASYDGTIRLWDTCTGEMLAVLTEHTDAVVAVAFSPSGRILASVSDDGTARIWNADTGAPLQVLEGHKARVLGVAFSPNGKRLLTASQDGAARLWSVKDGLEQRSWELHGGGKAVAFLPGGDRFITATAAGQITLWEMNSSKPLRTLTQGSVVWQAMEYQSATGLLGAVGDQWLLLVDPAKGEQALRRVPLSSPATSLAFSPDGSRVACGLINNSITVLDTATGEELMVLRGHDSEVYTVAFSPTGDRLASGDGHGIIRLWDTVPFRDRLPEIKAMQAAADDARAIVEKRYAKLKDWAAVATSLRANASLDDVLRRAALNEVLRRATSHASAATP